MKKAAFNENREMKEDIAYMGTINIMRMTILIKHKVSLKTPITLAPLPL